MVNVQLRPRTAWHVRTFFENTRDAEIRKFLPMKAATVEENLADFEQSILPGSTSFGRTVYVDGGYVGDIWCYCIHEEEEPDAMVSYCLFRKDLWGKGVTTRALGLFIAEIREEFGISTLGAFTFAENLASIRVLERNGFTERERFVEEGIESVYLQLDSR